MFCSTNSDKWKQSIACLFGAEAAAESAKIKNEFPEKEGNTKDGRGDWYTDDTNRWARVPREQFGFVQHNDNAVDAKNWFDCGKTDFHTANH